MNERLSTPVKLLGFAAVLALVFGVTWVAGAEVGPIDPPETAEHEMGQAGGEGGHGDDGGHDAEQQEATEALPGLAAARDGYRLVLADDVLDAGSRELAFTVEGPDGHPVTEFDVEHEKRLHLIVVRRDHEGFQHLHPTLDESTGAWTTEAQLAPGSWRVFTDFTPSGGPALVLGSDLLVPGRFDEPEPVKETRTDAVDGYAVAVDGTLEAGDHSELTLTVTKDGEPVTDLQPYLGAYGHLVALREGDLAYLHVHPAGEPGDGETDPGPEVEFGVEVPTAGRYHLYLDFQHRGVVRTAHLVLDAAGHATGEEHP